MFGTIDRLSPEHCDAAGLKQGFHHETKLCQEVAPIIRHVSRPEPSCSARDDFWLLSPDFDIFSDEFEGL